MNTEIEKKDQKIQVVEQGKVQEQPKAEVKPLSTHDRMMRASLSSNREFSLLR